MLKALLERFSRHYHDIFQNVFEWALGGALWEGNGLSNCEMRIHSLADSKGYFDCITGFTPILVVDSRSLDG